MMFLISADFNWLVYYEFLSEDYYVNLLRFFVMKMCVSCLKTVWFIFVLYLRCFHGSGYFAYTLPL